VEEPPPAVLALSVFWQLIKVPAKVAAIIVQRNRLEEGK
jgi:hypothetical protein